VVGGLAGGTTGAVGAGVASAAAPQIEVLQDQLKTALKDAGVNDSTANVIAGLVGSTTAATIGTVASGGSTAGVATAFNADLNNRQLHPDERRRAAELARKSDGKYTVEQIEDALRNAGNSDKGESVIAGMVVDPNQRNAIYDKGAVWTMGENGQLVQVLPVPASADLINFIQANTGDTYNWYTPSAQPATNPNAPRDRLTNQPLDAQGRYSRTVVIGGQMFEPKFHACATSACAVGNANLDMNDPATQAYIRALDQQVLKDIGTGATAGALVTPVGVPGALLGLLGISAAAGEASLDRDPVGTAVDKGIEEGLQSGGERFFRNVLGHSPAVAARAVALINLSGGWEAFRERVKADLLGMKPIPKGN
jgi:hypothetical protein